MALTEWDKNNFKTLQRAFANGDVALMDLRRRSDGKSVGAIVALGKAGEDITFTPFAVMVEGNPFELFDPPDPDGDGYIEQIIDAPELKEEDV